MIYKMLSLRLRKLKVIKRWFYNFQSHKNLFTIRNRYLYITTIFFIFNSNRAKLRVCFPIKISIHVIRSNRKISIFTYTFNKTKQFIELFTRQWRKVTPPLRKSATSQTETDHSRGPLLKSIGEFDFSDRIVSPLHNGRLTSRTPTWPPPHPVTGARRWHFSSRDCCLCVDCWSSDGCWERERWDEWSLLLWVFCMSDVRVVLRF